MAHEDAITVGRLMQLLSQVDEDLLVEMSSESAVSDVIGGFTNGDRYFTLENKFDCVDEDQAAELGLDLYR